MTISPDELAAALASQREDMIEAETRRIVKASERDGEGTLRPSSPRWHLFTTMEHFEPPAWLVENWIALETTTVIHSEPNIGKTLVMQYLMTRIALGRAAFPPKVSKGPAGEIPENGIAPLKVMQCPTLLLELDQSANITGSRFGWFRVAEGLKPDEPLEAYFLAPDDWHSITDPTDNLELREFIKQIDAKMVVIDSLSYVSGNVPENSDEMKNVMYELGRIAKSLHVAVVVIHHDRKEYSTQAGSGMQKMRGHSSIPAGCEIAVNLTKADADTNVIEMAMTKNKIGARRLVKFVEWSYATDTAGETQQGTFYVVDGQDVAAARAETIRAAIMEVVWHDDHKSQSDLIEKVQGRLKTSGVSGKLGEKAIAKELNHLVDDHKLQSDCGARGARTYKIVDGIVYKPKTTAEQNRIA